MSSNGRDRVAFHVRSHEDLIDRVARFETIRIADRQYGAELLTRQLTIDSRDLVSEASSASAQALYWGIEAARARRYVAQIEAAYRTWRDRTWLEIKSGEDSRTNKAPTDATADKLLRQAPEYQTWRGRKDDGQQQAEMAEAIYEAFKLKVQLIKIQAEIIRTEAGGSYYVTEAPRTQPARTPQEG